MYDEHYRSVLGYALRRVEAPEDAAEIVAETFLIAWRRIDDVPHGSEARLWLYGVARRVLANHRRGQRRRIRLGGRLRDELTAWPYEDAAGSAALETVVLAMAELSDDDREILRLVAWEGLTHDDLAIVFACSSNAAKIRVHRARKRLRAHLADSDVVKPHGPAGHERARRAPARPAAEEDR